MSSWLLSKPDPLFFKPSQGTDKPLGTAAENFEMSFENDRLNEIGSSKAESYSDVWGPIVDEINEKGEAKVSLAGRPFTIKKQFIDDLEETRMKK